KIEGFLAILNINGDQKLPFAVTSVDWNNFQLYYLSIDLASPSPSYKHKSQKMKRSLSNEEPQAETSRLRVPVKGQIQLVCLPVAFLYVLKFAFEIYVVFAEFITCCLL
ncbi:hypothetical protein Tco_1150860, partial [Tanacetum coccineum]